MIGTDGAGALLLLALTDSLSFGTLLVPVWLLMTPGRLRTRRVLLYLSTVAVAYFAIGVVLMAGGRIMLDGAASLLESTPALAARLLVGAALLTVSFSLDTKAARARAAERGRDGRIHRWRERATGDEGPALAVTGLAAAAVLVEVASMLPYVAATGVIVTQTTTWTVALPLLAGYCVVMVAPALVLTGARACAGGLVEAPLRGLDRWLTRNARSTTLWIIGIVGFFLAATAVSALGWTSP